MPMLSTLFTNPLSFFLWALALVIAITVHEFSHAWAADRLGDPTPKVSGRLNLNPLSHLDPLGTAAILLIGFGWGKPVIFDPYNLRSPRRDAALISLAGPASNLTLALIISLIMKTFMPSYSLLSFFAIPVITLNVMLAIFNLVPVYPLDGEKILAGLLSPQLASEYSRIMRQWGTIILIFLLIPLGGVSPIAALISPVINAITSLLI